MSYTNVSQSGQVVLQTQTQKMDVLKTYLVFKGTPAYYDQLSFHETFAGQ